MRKAFSKFSLINSNESKIITKYENFVSRTYCFYKKRCDDNQTVGNHDTKRAIIIIIIKLCASLFLIRCVLWPTPFIKYWTCNAYHYLGNALLINLAVLSATLAGNFGNGACFICYNLVNKERLLIYFDRFVHKKLNYRLNVTFRRKFFRRLNLFVYLLNTIHIPTVINWSCLICGPVIVGYFDPNVQFSLIGEIFIFMQTNH